MNVLFILKYSAKVLQAEHISHGYVLFIGHSNCSNVAAAYGNEQFGLIDNWLCSVKDVYKRKFYIFYTVSK
jgi:carbonic anhydrase